MIRNWLSLTALIGLTLLFLILWESPPEGFRRQQADTQPTKFLATTKLENTKTRSFDDTGKLAYTFDAATTQHYQKNPKRQTAKDYTDFTSPYLVFYNDPAHPWHVQAKEGRARKNGTIIDLKGDVVAWKLDADGSRSELTTTYLRLKPEQQYAETNKPVMIDSAGSKTRAVGMKAFLQQDKIELLSRVRGIHEPI